MTPGVLTPAERRDETTADLFRKVNPHQPPDPDLIFRGDLGTAGRPEKKGRAA